LWAASYISKLHKDDIGLLATTTLEENAGTNEELERINGDL